MNKKRYEYDVLFKNNYDAIENAYMKYRASSIPSIVYVNGEKGTGKTRLAEFFLERHNDVNNIYKISFAKSTNAANFLAYVLIELLKNNNSPQPEYDKFLAVYQRYCALSNTQEITEKNIQSEFRNEYIELIKDSIDLVSDLDSVNIEVDVLEDMYDEVSQALFENLPEIAGDIVECVPGIKPIKTIVSIYQKSKERLKEKEFQKYLLQLQNKNEYELKEELISQFTKTIGQNMRTGNEPFVFIIDNFDKLLNYDITERELILNSIKSIEKQYRAFLILIQDLYKKQEISTVCKNLNICKDNVVRTEKIGNDRLRNVDINYIPENNYQLSINDKVCLLDSIDKGAQKYKEALKAACSLSVPQNRSALDNWISSFFIAKKISGTSDTWNRKMKMLLSLPHWNEDILYFLRRLQTPIDELVSGDFCLPFADLKWKKSQKLCLTDTIRQKISAQIGAIVWSKDLWNSVTSKVRRLRPNKNTHPEALMKFIYLLVWQSDYLKLHAINHNISNIAEYYDNFILRSIDINRQNMRYEKPLFKERVHIIEIVIKNLLDNLRDIVSAYRDNAQELNAIVDLRKHILVIMYSYYKQQSRNVAYYRLKDQLYGAQRIYNERYYYQNQNNVSDIIKRLNDFQNQPWVEKPVKEIVNSWVEKMRRYHCQLR